MRGEGTGQPGGILERDIGGITEGDETVAAQGRTARRQVGDDRVGCPGRTAGGVYSASAGWKKAGKAGGCPTIRKRLLPEFACTLSSVMVAVPPQTLNAAPLAAIRVFVALKLLVTPLAA